MHSLDGFGKGYERDYKEKKTEFVRKNKESVLQNMEPQQRTQME